MTGRWEEDDLDEICESHMLGFTEINLNNKKFFLFFNYCTFRNLLSLSS